MSTSVTPFLMFEGRAEEAMRSYVGLLFVESEAAEVDRLFAALSEDGEALMPLDTYRVSPRYAWMTDRFGVSWQQAAN